MTLKTQRNIKVQKCTICNYMFNETSHNYLQHFAQKFLLNVPEDIYIMKNLSSDRAVKYNLHFIASFI
jgi:transposase